MLMCTRRKSAPPRNFCLSVKPAHKYKDFIYTQDFIYIYSWVTPGIAGREFGGGCARRAPRSPHVPAAEQSRETAPGLKLCPNIASINPTQHQKKIARPWSDHVPEIQRHCVGHDGGSLGHQAVPPPETRPGAIIACTLPRATVMTPQWHKRPAGGHRMHLGAVCRGVQ